MKKHTTFLLSLLFLSLGILISACDSDLKTDLKTDFETDLEQNEQPNKNKPNTSVQVTDFSGKTISLESPAQRIVALAPHIVENIYSAGAGEKLVGVMQYSDYPEQAKQLPLIGSYEKINFEKIIELNPDLVMAWESGNSHASTQRLKELGFPVYIDQPHNLSDVAKSVKDIGILTGNTTYANEIATAYLAQVAKVTAKYENASKITAFYQVWNQPLQTINGQHIISDAIETCGGVNIYANEFAVAPVINIESILERDPQVIIASGVSESRPEWLDEWLKWPSLEAVKRGNLFFVNPNHVQRHTLRLLSGIESICEQLDVAREQ